MWLTSEFLSTSTQNQSIFSITYITPISSRGSEKGQKKSHLVVAAKRIESPTHSFQSKRPRAFPLMLLPPHTVTRDIQVNIVDWNMMGEVGHPQTVVLIGKSKVRIVEGGRQIFDIFIEGSGRETV